MSHMMDERELNALRELLDYVRDDERKSFYEFGFEEEILNGTGDLRPDRVDQDAQDLLSRHIFGRIMILDEFVKKLEA